MNKFHLSKIKTGIIALFLVCGYNSSFAQGEIPVDMHTGTPTIQIPIWTVTDHDLAESVGLSYTARGLQLTEQKGVVGVGWRLQAGGSITREVRGLPDDFTGTSPDMRTGWFYNTNAGNTALFSTTADLSTATCSDENTINTTLTGYNYSVDTEPDIFYYSAGGISGSFVFDNTLTIRLIPYRDVKIEYTTVSPTDKKITSFTITANNGVKYTFDLAVSVTRAAHKMTGITDVEFLKRDFKLYDYTINNTGVVYNSEWKLTKMESYTGATISYQYESVNYETKDTVRVGIRKLNSADLFSKAIYRTVETGSIKNISAVRSSSSEDVNFTYTNGMISAIEIVDQRKSSQSIKQFNFAYTSASTRTFLASISEVSGCDQLPPYRFTYVSGSLPSIYSKGKDFWGYYNGKTNAHLFPAMYVYPSEPLTERFRLLPIPGYAGSQYTLAGADRTPDFASMQRGSLETITYPWGGSATLNYEPHEYYDPHTGQDLLGGGLRIKSIVYFDGVNAQSKVVKNFDYTETSGISSGRLIDKPLYVMPLREYRDPEGATVKSYTTLAAGTAQALWEHLIARTEQDISPSVDGDIIGYKQVKVSRPGAGSATFEFSVPAVYGETSSGDWIATQNKFVRPNTCPSMEIVTAGGEWAFAYSPNPNFSYKRGVMLKKTERDLAGNKIREITYTPQYIYKGMRSHKTWGVSYEHYPYSTSAIYFYGKYFLLADVEQVPGIESIVTYDANDQSKTRTETVEYFYGTSAHRLLVRTKTTSADGTIYTSRLKYPLDFGTIAINSDDQLKTISTLQTSFRNGVPIERRSSFQRPGESEKTLSASLIKFSEFGVSGTVLPYQQLSLKIDQGITDFVTADKALQSGTYVLTHDSRYSTDNTFIAHDEYQMPLTSVGRDRIVKSTHWGFHKTVPVVQAVNARHNEFVFSDFETDYHLLSTDYEFQLSDPLVYSRGRTGEKSLHPSVKLAKTIQKANVSNYILSFWLKKQSAAVDFQLVLKNASTSAVVSTVNFTVDPSGTDFEFFEKVIPVTSAPSSFIVELQGQGFNGEYSTSWGLLPAMDDVAFYPEGADLVSYTYNFPYGQNSVTDASASTVHVVHDGLGREKYVLDKDKNIIKKNTYKFASDPVRTLTAEINGPVSAVDLTSYSYSAIDVDCIDGVKYEWNFEGAGFEDRGRTTSHIFSTTGTFEVTLRKSHPEYGTATHTIYVTVTLKTFDVTICGKGAKRYSDQNGVLESYTCSDITASPPGDAYTLFKVTGMTTTDPVVSYQWYVYDDFSQQWKPSGTGTAITLSLINSAVIHGDLGVYVVRCDVTTTTGRVGTSNTLNVRIVYP